MKMAALSARLFAFLLVFICFSEKLWAQSAHESLILKTGKTPAMTVKIELTRLVNRQFLLEMEWPVSERRSLTLRIGRKSVNADSPYRQPGVFTRDYSETTVELHSMGWYSYK